MKKIAIIEVKGGLGNQLFQYNFSRIFSDKDFIVFYNFNFFKNFEKFEENNTKRELQLSFLNYKFKETNTFFLNAVKLLNIFINSKKLNKFFPFVNKYIFKFYKERDFDKNFKQNKFALINYFDGYWQDIKYLSNHEGLLKDLFVDKQKFSSKPDVAIHVRRNDYLKLGIELNLKYYTESIGYLENKLESFKFDVFTDDKKWVLEQNIFSNCNNIYDNFDEPIKAFQMMRSYKHFIIANSTFSYLAAFLSDSNDSIVCYPSIWNRNKEFNSLKNRNWIEVIS